MIGAQSYSTRDPHSNEFHLVLYTVLLRNERLGMSKRVESQHLLLNKL